jgi:hypothetical protein
MLQEMLQGKVTNVEAILTASFTGSVFLFYLVPLISQFKFFIKNGSIKK